MYKIEFTREMKRNAKLMQKRGKDMSKLTHTLQMLASGELIPPKHQDHQLVVSFKDFRECHIAPDWLLIYKIHNDVLILTATETGTHSDLFGK